MGPAESQVRHPRRQQEAPLAIAPARMDNMPAPIITARDQGRVRHRARLVAGPGGKRAGQDIRRPRSAPPFDLEIRHGERVGIVGPNGAGKTTLFRLVMGRRAERRQLRLRPSIKSSATTRRSTKPSIRTTTPMESVRKIKPMNEQQALAFLVGFLFKRDDVMNRIGALSGGERSRLQVATLILQGANFLLLDEPTNNLDIPSSRCWRTRCWSSAARS